MTKYFSSLVEQSLSRSTESTLSILGITDPKLRQHLTNVMSSECGSEGSFLSQPIFEQTFGWAESELTMEQLAREKGLLSGEIVDSLDSKSNGRYRFGANFKPFTHQLASWTSLLQHNRSVVVTSGTGSGKTECFMVPVLEDLYREYSRGTNKPLVGVRALFLYPLNALINSQRERLNAWTKSFGDGMRYCLYNGNTEEKSSKVRAEQALTPNEILSRELMREQPAPILVTNGTMLEYMMVRQVDEPIVRISREKKSLRWIVLDEAHTYVGSQAAELALQLRRVMAAFGVSPSEVRFVATSATIAGEDSAEQLKQFLSDLSGVPVAQIDVLGGSRVIPELPKVKSVDLSLEQIELFPALDESNPEVSPTRFEALVQSPRARTLRRLIVSTDKRLKLNEIVDLMQKTDDWTLTASDVLRWLDVCSGTKASDDSPAFLKLRAHFFQRTTHGLWACIDKECTAKHGTPLETGWPYGYVYATQRQRCTCGSLLFELTFCNDCNEPHLFARDRNGHLVQWTISEDDEFSLQVDETSEESEPAGDGRDVEPRMPLVLSAIDNLAATYVNVDINKISGEFGADKSQRIRIALNDIDSICSNAECGYKGYQGASPFRRAMLGGPFYVTNAVPTMLEYCQDFKDEEARPGYGPQSLPARGRRLITFTDSRQGTARMSVRMQQEAERSKLRGAVVEILSWKQRAQAGSQALSDTFNPEQLQFLIGKLKDDIDILKSLNMPGEVKESEEKLLRLTQHLNGGSKYVILASMSWGELASELKDKADIKGSILLHNKYQKPEVFGQNDGPLKLTEMLLFREFMRRPKRQNSLETLGLVKVHYSNLGSVSKCPEYWEQKSLTINDWRDFLKVTLDFYVRENSFIQVDDSWLQWIGSRFSSKALRSPLSKEESDGRVKRWPQIINKNISHRLVKLLFLGSNLNPQNTADQDIVNLWLRDAWSQLTSPNIGILKSDGNRFQLPKEHLSFSLLSKAFVCPITNKLLDTSFRGFTPYLPVHIDFSQLTDLARSKWKTEIVDVPQVWEFDQSQYDYTEGLDIVREKLQTDARVVSLRGRNLWTDISDRAVEGGFYYRTAEHSAQQSSERLESYEEDFKKGKINVLNCSTTMEMGVDIGGISAVVMNNVPPHPANYLQRAGRAGRSKESRAVSYTLCKNNPHDQLVFANPSWPFETKIPAPAVTLSSDRLVQRHVNSFLLADFLCNSVGFTQTDRIKLNTQWFFDDKNGISICDRFINELGVAVSNLDTTLKELVRGTSLAVVGACQLRRNALTLIKGFRDRWLETFKYLSSEEATAKEDSLYKVKLRIELNRHCNEYLLRDLAARTFLPGYGFPTDVVNFDNFTIEDYKREKQYKNESKQDREDNISRYKGLPSRNLAVAIREYAPGSEIVIDGRVFRSAGVSLHWHNLGGGNEAQRMDIAWRCHLCGEVGYEEGLIRGGELFCSNSACGEKIKSLNILRVLKPAGFVTDSYESTSNNIQRLKYIPVQPARVFIKGEKVSLPNPELGTMAYGANGKVFYHSSGEHGEGFALCMYCGRAESMLPARNGEIVYPTSLSPNGTHHAPRPTKNDKGSNNQLINCEGSGSILSNIHLGAEALTDVFELTLLHPVRVEYLADDAYGVKIALTISLALRLALAETLGISASELGYATRPGKLPNGSLVRIIQLYDVISGGAGFASSAALYIEHILSLITKKLTCSHCESGCSECLIDSQTRHDYDKIDRKAALDWLGADFENYVGLTDKDKLSFSDAIYVPGSIENVIRRLINQGFTRVSFVASGDISAWDMLAPVFRKSIQNYVLNDGIKVDLILLPKVDQSELLIDLQQLATIGVNIFNAAGDLCSYSVAQAFKGNKVVTLASRSDDAKVPGPSWHQNSEAVVMSKTQKPFSLVPYEFTPFVNYSENARGIVDLSIQDHLNGSFVGFGERFWSLVASKDSRISDVLLSGKIKTLSYSDRYIQNPAAVAMLGALMRSFKGKLLPESSICVKTLFKSGRAQGRKAYEDWISLSDFEAFSENWLSAMVGKKVAFIVETSNRNIAHHRCLEIFYENGKVLKVRLDQGVAYWQIRFNSSRDVWFDFGSSLTEQLNHMEKAVESASVLNSEEKWATDVLVELVDR